MANHTAAIHVLKSKLQITDDDYRALLSHLTGKVSSKGMTSAEQIKVRDHMQGLAERMGVAMPSLQRPLTRTEFGQARERARPRERKVWALWHQLHRDGIVHNHSRKGLDAWVERQVGVSSLRFCKDAQLDTLIEALKAWKQRGT